MYNFLKHILCFTLFLFLTGCFGNNNTSEDDNNSNNDNSNSHNDGNYSSYFINQTDPYKAINVIVMGDVYIKEDLAKNGLYEIEAKKLINGLFCSPPFSQYKKDFNAYIIFCESKERGADSSPYSENADTVFDSNFGENGIERLLVIKNGAKVDEYLLKTGLTAKNHMNKNILLISVNDIKYGGSGGYYSVVSRNCYAVEVALHEIGHSFGVLADEYDYGAAFPKEWAATEKNVDLTDNLTYIKWKQFIKLHGYENVGAYEGAYYYPKGVWRPCQDCLMRSLGMGFCPICREAIVKEIYFCNGLNYSFYDFLLKDKENLNEQDNDKNCANYPKMFPDDLRFFH